MEDVGHKYGFCSQLFREPPILDALRSFVALLQGFYSTLHHD